MQEAEVKGQVVPEPFDVRTEEGLEAGALLTPDRGPLEASVDSGRSSGTYCVRGWKNYVYYKTPPDRVEVEGGW